MTKYNKTDGKTVLDAEDDAAQAAWGGNWRMPTTAEFQALGNAVTTAWTSNYNDSNVAGMVCTDKTDNSKVLFFPACGYANVGRVDNVGYNAGYWSKTLFTTNDYVNYAYEMSLSSVSNTDWSTPNERYFGYAIRGILAEN